MDVKRVPTFFVIDAKGAIRYRVDGFEEHTLFDVPDQESAGLMRNFYISLKSGQGKLDALRGA